jgi:ABC-type sugar transport system ATPase subunit
MALATRIAVMDKGRIVQFAPPIDIYRRPATTFVANFVGNPPMNLVETEAMIADGGLKLRAEGLAASGQPVSKATETALQAGNRLTLGIRPEHLTIAEDGAAITLTGDLFANENMGPESLVTIERPDSGRVTARIFTDEHLAVGDRPAFGFTATHVHLFDAAGNRLPADGESVSDA